MHNSQQTLQAERLTVNLPSKSISMHTSASGWTLARTQCGSSEKRQRTDSLRPTLTPRVAACDARLKRLKRPGANPSQGSPCVHVSPAASFVHVVEKQPELAGE